MSDAKANGPVPRLRFPEFRNAGPWDVKRLGELLAQPPDYGINAPAVPFSEELPTYLRITDINDDGTLNRNGLVSVDVPVADDRYLSEGDIVLARTGASVGKSYRYNPHDGELVFAGYLIRIKPDNSRLNSVYLANFLTTRQYWRWVEQTSARSGQPGINAAEYSKMPLPLPPYIEEQQKIADCLSSLDELIQAEKAQLEALRQHKKGLMQKLFPAPGETTPRLRFPEFRNAGAWEVCSIGDLAERIAQGGTPKTSVAEYWNGGIPWITPADMGDDAMHHYTEKTQRTISKAGLEKSAAEILPVNSVIISSRAPIGYATINKVEMATNQGCKGIIPKDGVYHEFLYFSLLKSSKRLNELGAGSGFKEISISILRKFKIPVPSYEEQQKIADCLSSLDELIQAKTAHIEALKTHKHGLMQQLFPQEVA